MDAGTPFNESHEDMTVRYTDSPLSFPMESDSGALSRVGVYILSILCLFLITANALLLYCIQKNKKSNWAKQTLS